MNEAEILRYLEEYHNLKVSRPTLARHIADANNVKVVDDILKDLDFGVKR